MIDASLYSQIQAPKQTNMLEQFARMQQIQGAQSQNRLADLMYGKEEREAAGSMAVDAAYKDATGADGTIDRKKLYAGIAKISGSKLPGVQKGFAETDNVEVLAQKNKIGLMREKLSMAGQILGSVKDQASYDAARQSAAANGLDVANMPPQYNPEFVAGKLKEAMTVKEQLEQHWKAKGYDLDVQKVAETGRHNKATELGAADGRQLTDTRARDFNNTKVEENKLKREAKDETTQLTKNSQVASFDTMLGTLDRLGKHPGLSRSVGAVGMFPTMPGSDSANFQAELNTFQSQAFIPMVAQLKGMGALSDAEGKKLTAAVGALDPKMGEPAFRESVKRITDDMTAARDRMVGGGNAKSDGRTGSWGDPQAPSAPVNIKNAADYANIPSGATYIDPNGKMRTKK